MPKPRLGDWPDRPGGRNRSTGQDNGPRAALAPGDEAGLVQFGAQPERLPPGSRSSHRHWHEAEDELVFVLSGELVLVEDTETVLRAGERLRDARQARLLRPELHQPRQAPVLPPVRQAGRRLLTRVQ